MALYQSGGYPSSSGTLLLHHLHSQLDILEGRILVSFHTSPFEAAELFQKQPEP